MAEHLWLVGLWPETFDFVERFGDSSHIAHLVLQPVPRRPRVTLARFARFDKAGWLVFGTVPRLSSFSGAIS